MLTGINQWAFPKDMTAEDALKLAARFGEIGHVQGLSEAAEAWPACGMPVNGLVNRIRDVELLPAQFCGQGTMQQGGFFQLTLTYRHAPPAGLFEKRFPLQVTAVVMQEAGCYRFIMVEAQCSG